MTPVSEGTLAQVEAAVPPDPPGDPPRLIHRRVGMWARETICLALLDLVARGRVRRIGPAGSRTYWRAP